MENSTPQLRPGLNLLKAIKKIFGKLSRNTDDYPVYYYKKPRRLRRHSNGPMG